MVRAGAGRPGSLGRSWSGNLLGSVGRGIESNELCGSAALAEAEAGRFDS